MNLPSLLAEWMEWTDIPSLKLIGLGVIIYLGLLWLSIIIWVTRDSINRSGSLLFQSFSILLNIAVPILGVFFYLIIRPGQTNLERYYEELERRMLIEGSDDKNVSCEKCMTLVDKSFVYCPHCGESIKKTCPHCKKSVLDRWSICPFCGKKTEDKPAIDEKMPKSPAKKSVKR